MSACVHSGVYETNASFCSQPPSHANGLAGSSWVTGRPGLAGQLAYWSRPGRAGQSYFRSAVHSCAIVDDDPRLGAPK